MARVYDEHRHMQLERLVLEQRLRPDGTLEDPALQAELEEYRAFEAATREREIVARMQAAAAKRIAAREAEERALAVFRARLAEAFGPNQPATIDVGYGRVVDLGADAIFQAELADLIARTDAACGVHARENEREASAESSRVVAFPKLVTPPIDVEVETPPYAAFGKQLQALREEARWTVEELAAEIEYDKTTVNDHLQGWTRPRLQAVGKYEKVFGARLAREVRLVRPEKNTPKTPPRNP